MANKGLRAMALPRSAERLHDQALWSEALVLHEAVKAGLPPLILLSRSERARGAKLYGREKRVACSVIQWLGSNCGKCFMREALWEPASKAVPRKVVKEFGYRLHHLFLSDEEKRNRAEISGRDRRAAYSVIRWMGSARGKHFMREVLEKIKMTHERDEKRRRKADREWLESIGKKAA